MVGLGSRRRSTAILAAVLLGTLARGSEGLGLGGVSSLHGSSEPTFAEHLWSGESAARIRALLDTPVDPRPAFRPVATFDADGTLWGGDAFDAFCQVLIRRGRVDGARAAEVAQEYANARSEDRKGSLLESCRLLRGLTLAEIADAAEEGWVDLGKGTGLRDSVRPELRNLVSCLRAKGWRVCMVTASPVEAVLTGAQHLGIDEGDVFGVRLETDASGLVTGEVCREAPLTWRDGKAGAIQAFGLSQRVLLAGGNSLDDVPMLDCAKHLALLIAPGAAGGGADDPEDIWAGDAEKVDTLRALCKEKGFLFHVATV